ncbi:hypothetical protein CMUS01_14714 [Colletotrichum musicola]|uniref:Uncharacterized protein n=1 Tax=Colletotrichum musicola TaxID=2175873 RepID=A0A8H6J2M1_9PEZI|nr:hypothetical protein CMUS01_14714 [Colletotrichum musicola]
MYYPVAGAEVHAIYADIASNVFVHPKDAVFFHTETEALAHFLLKESLLTIQARSDDPYSVFLFLDFGGHNMVSLSTLADCPGQSSFPSMPKARRGLTCSLQNGCVYNLVQGEDDERPSFYRIGKASGTRLFVSSTALHACILIRSPGAGGGSEHWTYLVGVKALSKILRESNQSGISPAKKREMLEKFNREKGRCGPVEMGNGQHFVFHMMHWPIDLGPEDLEQCFEEAHDRVFALAKSNIEHVAKYKVPPQIIVSGGTSRHPAVQRRLIEFCAAAGAPKPNFITGKSITFSSGKIAQGVAMAASNCLTIQQFMDRGAAFGVQMRQCANRGNSNPERLWDNYGFFLLSKNGKKTHSFKSGGRDECKIICDPFFETHQSEVLHYDRCYDVIELGRAKGGGRSISLSLVEENGSTSLVIKTTRTWKKGEKRRREGFKESPPLPLYFDGDTNCAHVDERDFDVTALDFELGSAEKDHRPATDRTQEASEIHVSTAEAPAVQSEQLSPALPYVPTVHSRFVPVNRGPSKQSDLSYPAPRRAQAPVKVRPETSGRAKPTWKRGDAPEFNPYTGELKLGPRTPAPKRIADCDWPVPLAKKSRMEETTPDTYM